ncbi:MAG: hypothetical protein HXX08_12815 [Chloroflexi bacterium]|uniref:Uncharacterized protein n=1 Tax=Candidatus Chlorohelix allophototropha TaxID=3003348 RepID=A0A8T7M3U2_9CHLR|nr:hypothetical protein [Chloroflexota bacterium]WJW69984.1 hypothetical protein OZ401_004785 [Chloroflexota bacterium L227-S17]
MQPFAGYLLERTISPELIEGLKTGLYQLYGGTVRIAPGFEGAGQIVRHLIPISGDVSTYASGFTHMLPLGSKGFTTLLANTNSANQATQLLLGYGSQLMTMASLNLAVTAVGFAVLTYKLDQLSKKLEEIKNDVKAVRQLLERQELAKLRTALADLERLPDFSGSDRLGFINNARVTLSRLAHQYAELLAQEEEEHRDMAYEELFCIASLSHVRCYAELGEFQLAQKEMAKTLKTWRTEARKIADNLLGKDPSRYLHSDFVNEIPITTVIDWLNFAREEEKGFEWLEYLRSKMPPYYKQNITLSLNLPVQFPEQDKLEAEKKFVIPSLNKLITRDKVLEGYVTQYALLGALKVTPTEFEKQIAAAAPENAVDGYLILEPVSQPTTEQKG